MNIQPIIDALAKDFETTQPWEGPTTLGLCMALITVSFSVCMIIVTVRLCSYPKNTDNEEESK